MLEENAPSQSIINAAALKVAVSEALHHPDFIKAVAEEILDALDGFDDNIVLKRLKEAKNSGFASESEVFSALKGE